MQRVDPTSPESHLGIFQSNIYAITLKPIFTASLSINRQKAIERH